MVFCYIILHRLKTRLLWYLAHFCDFPGGPVVKKKLLAATAGGAGLIPDLGNKILHAAWPKKKKRMTHFYSDKTICLHGCLL